MPPAGTTATCGSKRLLFDAIFGFADAAACFAAAASTTQTTAPAPGTVFFSGVRTDTVTRMSPPAAGPARRAHAIARPAAEESVGRRTA